MARKVEFRVLFLLFVVCYFFAVDCMLVPVQCGCAEQEPVKCMQTLSRINSTLGDSMFVSSFSVGDKDRTEKCRQAVSGLINTVKFYEKLSQKVPNIVLNNRETKGRKDFLNKAVAWIMLETFDFSSCEDIFSISSGCLEMMGMNGEIQRKREEPHRLQSEIEEARRNFEKEEGEHRVHMIELKRREKTTRNKMELQEEQHETEVGVEQETRDSKRRKARIEVEVDTDELRARQAQHKLDMKLIETTAGSQIELKLNDLRTQIEKLISEQKKHRVDGSFVVSEKIFSGMKMSLDSLCENFSRVASGAKDVCEGVALVKGVSVAKESTQQIQELQSVIEGLKRDRSSVNYCVRHSFVTIEDIKKDPAILQTGLESLERMLTDIKEYSGGAIASS